MPILETLLIYLGLFAMVYGLLVAEERTQNPLVRVCLLTATVVLPALLSALRDVAVGTDTQMYLEGIQMWTREGVWPISFKRFEIGFKGLVRILAFCSDSPRAVLLCIYVLTLGVAVWSFDRLRLLAPLRLTYVAYLCICLIPSWNAMRQMLACSFLLLGFSYLVAGCPWRCLLAMLVSLAFHRSSFVGFAVLPLVALSDLRSKVYLGLVAAFVTGGIAVAVPFAPGLLTYEFSFGGETQHAVVKHFLTCGVLAMTVLHMTKPEYSVRVFAWHKRLSRLLGEIVLLAMVLQLFHFSTDLADRLIITFMPIIAFVCAFVFMHGSRIAKIVSFTYVFPYSFLYHYVVCNQNECNVYAFAF